MFCIDHDSLGRGVNLEGSMRELIDLTLRLAHLEVFEGSLIIYLELQFSDD